MAGFATARGRPGTDKEGRFYVWQEGDEAWREVAREDYAIASQSPAGLMMGEAANRVGQLAAGLVQLGPGGQELAAPLGEYSGELERTSALRRAAQGTTSAASFGGMLPDIALGVATAPLAPASLAGRAGLYAAEGALLGAAGEPEAPLRPALVGGALGGGLGVAGDLAAVGLGQLRPGMARGIAIAEAVTARVRGRGAARAAAEDTARIMPEGAFAPLSRPATRESIAARQAARLEAQAPGGGVRGIGAAETPGPSLYAGQGRQLEGIASAEDMLDEGFPLSDTQAGILDATDGLELQRLRQLDNAEEIAGRTRSITTWARDFLGGASRSMDRGELAARQQAWVNKRIAEEMGITGRSGLTSSAVSRRMSEVGKDFERIIEETPGPIDMRGVADEWENVIEDHMLDAGNPTLSRVASQFNDLMSRVKNNQGDVQALAKFRNRLTAKIDAAMRSPEHFETGEALDDLRRIMDRRFRRNWSQEMRDDYDQAQKQWFVGKAALKTRAATGDRGDVNLKTFLGNYEGSGSSRRTQLLLAVNRDFFQKMKAAGAAMARETGDTGSGQTATEGILNGLASMGLGMVPGGGLLR